MHLNHPETISSTPICEKIVFHETGPWCQKRLGTTALGEYSCKGMRKSELDRGKGWQTVWFAPDA